MKCLPLFPLLLLLPLVAGGQGRAPEENKKLVLGKYDKVIAKGLQWLIRHQNPKKGDFGGGMYAHGLATLAVCEAYALSGDPKLRTPAQRAINFIIFAQHPSNGGWRYSPGQEGDLSVTGWQVMALRCAEMAGLQVPKQTMQRAIHFVGNMMSPTDNGYGYTGPGSTPTMTAVGLLCRQKLQDWGSAKPEISGAIKEHLWPLRLKERDRKKNVYFYFYATQVMRNFGGQQWDAWNEGQREGLIKSQDGLGSWESTGDPHGGAGGRLMITSMNLLTLEVYYRYPLDATGEARVSGKKGANALSVRSREARIQTLADLGGSVESEAAVARGLDWIAKQQATDGHWSLDGAFRDKGTPNDVAGTAFGLLPLIGTGYSHRPTTGDPLDRVLSSPETRIELKKAINSKKE